MMFLRSWDLQDELDRLYEHAPANERPLFPWSAIDFAAHDERAPGPLTAIPGGFGEARTIAPRPDADITPPVASGRGIARTGDL